MKATSSEGSGASRTTSRRKASAWPGGCPSSGLCRTVRAVSRTPSETSFTFAIGVFAVHLILLRHIQQAKLMDAQSFLHRSVLRHEAVVVK